MCPSKHTESHSKILILGFAQNESEKDVLASESIHHMYMSQNKKSTEKKEKFYNWSEN